ALERDKRRAARDAGACGGTARIGHGDPVEILADLRIHPADLPASRQIHHDAPVRELLERITISCAADTAPHLLRHRTVTVPVVELLRHRLVAIVDGEIAFGVEILRAHADRRTREAMSAAIEC